MYSRMQALAQTFPLRGTLAAGSVLLVALLAGTSHAHTMTVGANGGAANGIEIASIAHSDMEILAEYRPEIISLAERQIETDDRFRRLLNFSKIQYTYRVWGLVPGALSDEESDFNACSHAYLASAWALLKHMESKPATAVEARAIEQSIEIARAAGPTLVLCKSSADVFYTDKVIVPPRLYATAGLLSGLAVVGGLLSFAPNRRKPV